MQEQVKQIMADILNLDLPFIGGSTTKEATSSWDSLNHISLALALEQEFRVTLDPSDIESMTSFENIIRVLERKLRV
jgi:acyl carrier protein